MGLIEPTPSRGWSAQDDIALYFRLSHPQRVDTQWRSWLPRLLTTVFSPSQQGDQLPCDPALQLDVLVVDDQPDSVEPLLRALAKWGCRAQLASSAAEALSILGSRRPRLMLLDIAMPQMDGMRLLAMLRGQAATRDLTIAMLTADPLRDAEARGMGACDYLVKPLDFAKMRPRIERLLTLST